MMVRLFKKDIGTPVTPCTDPDCSACRVMAMFEKKAIKCLPTEEVRRLMEDQGATLAPEEHSKQYAVISQEDEYLGYIDQSDVVMLEAKRVIKPVEMNYYLSVKWVKDHGSNRSDTRPIADPSRRDDDRGNEGGG